MMERYEIIRILGKGAGGRVLLATEKESGKYVNSFVSSVTVNLTQLKFTFN